MHGTGVKYLCVSPDKKCILLNIINRLTFETENVFSVKQGQSFFLLITWMNIILHVDKILEYVHT